MLSGIRNKFHELKSHQGVKKYAANTSWMMVEQVLRLISGLFVGVWIARYLGPEQFGVLSYVLAITAIFGGIAKLGLDGVLVRELVQYPEQAQEYMGTVFWLKIAGAILSFFLIFIMTLLVENSSEVNLYILIVSVGMLFQSFEVIDFYHQSKVEMKKSSVAKIFQLSSSSIVKIIMVICGAEIEWFVVMAMLDIVILGAGYLVIYGRKKLSEDLRRFDIKKSKLLIRDSWPLMLSAIAVMIYMRIDQIMISSMLGLYEVGVYSAAVKISEVFYFIPVVMSASLFPAILNAKKTDYNKYIKRIKNLYVLLVWMSLLIAMMVTIFGNKVVLLLYGVEYSSTSEILAIQVWGLVFVSLGVASSKWLLAEGLVKLAMWRVLIGCFLNILLNVLLIKEFGVLGAAYATLISQFFAGFLCDLFFKDTRIGFFMKLNSFWNFK